ncbi:DNA recombinase [Streptococcus pneumoniae]
MVFRLGVNNWGLKLQTEDFVKANRLLLRKIIQSVTVYEENFVISFKSGIELEV